MLSQLIYLRANLEGFFVKTISSTWKMPKVWFQKYMHRKSSKVQNRQTSIYQKWHQATDFLSLASLGFWNIIGLSLKEKLCLSVHKCMCMYPYIKKKKQSNTQTYVHMINTYAARKKNTAVIKWKLFHFLKARLGPNSLGHIRTALAFVTWETMSSTVPL